MLLHINVSGYIVRDDLSVDVSCGRGPGLLKFSFAVLGLPAQFPTMATPLLLPSHFPNRSLNSTRIPVGSSLPLTRPCVCFMVVE